MAWTARALDAARALLRRAALAAALAAPGAAAAETLTDALIGAYQTSGLLQQNRALLRAADEDVAIAVAALYPVLNYAATANYTVTRADTPGESQINPVSGLPIVDPVTGAPILIGGGRRSTSELTGTLGLTAQITLLDGGRNRLSIDAAKEAVLATRATLRDVEQDVLLRAVVAFFSVLRDEEFVSLRQNNVRLISEELRAAQDRFEVGEITRTDVSLAEARLAEARSFLASAEGDVTVSREEYLAVVGRYPAISSSPRARCSPPPPSRPRAPSPCGATPPSSSRSATSPSPRSTSGAPTPSAGRRSRSKGSSRGRWPKGGGGVTRSDGLTLQYGGPIYQGGRLDALYRQAVARAEASRAVLLVTVEQVRQDVATAFMNLSVAQATLESNRQQVSAQQVAFEGTREEATLGARTTLDVLDAEQDLLDARTNVVAATTNQFVAAYQLLASMGLLTVEELGLGIVEYDPEAYYEAVREAPVVSPRGRRLDAVLKRLGQN